MSGCGQITDDTELLLISWTGFGLGLEVLRDDQAFSALLANMLTAVAIVLDGSSLLPQLPQSEISPINGKEFKIYSEGLIVGYVIREYNQISVQIVQANALGIVG